MAGLSGGGHNGNSLRLALPCGGAAPPGAALTARRSATVLCPSLLLLLLVLVLLLVLTPMLLVLLASRLLVLLLALRWRPAAASCLVGLQAQAAHLSLHTWTQRLTTPRPLVNSSR